jgi:hypothetical protein
MSNGGGGGSGRTKYNRSSSSNGALEDESLDWVKKIVAAAVAAGASSVGS